MDEKLMRKTYTIELNGEVIGRTNLEKADASMGVAFGVIKDDNKKVNYEFIKSYCQTYGIDLVSDYPEDKLIETMTIENLKVISPEGVVIKSLGNQIYGMDNDVYEISLQGITYPFYEKEFPHHVKADIDRFKN